MLRWHQFFFLKQKTAYDMRISDWSSDVCSSDLLQPRNAGNPLQGPQHPRRAGDDGRGRAEAVRTRAVDRAQARNPARRGPELHQARPAGDHAVRRRGAAGETVEGAFPPRHRAHAVHPRRAHHRPALPRHRAPARGAAQAARRRQHDRGDRAQPGRDQDCGPGRRPRPRRRPPRRHDHRRRHAGRAGDDAAVLHRPVPGQVAGHGQAGDRGQGQGSQGDEEGRGAQEVRRMSLDNRTALFRMPIALRWRDLDAFNHVNNSTFMTYLEEARIRWFESLDEEWVTEQTAPLLAAVQMNYRVPIPYPAEVIVELFADRVGNSSVTIGHTIASADGATVYADGHVVMVWIDRASGRPTPLPGAVRRVASM